MSRRRGCLSKKVQEVAKKFMGREITILELRLIPYIQYVMVNEQKIVYARITIEEIDILSQWEKEGYINRENSVYVSITREFWDFMCEVLYLAYVDYVND